MILLTRSPVWAKISGAADESAADHEEKIDELI
jgi:hypothetical protein